MRIDRLLCELNIGSRSQVRELLKKGLVQVDGTCLRRPESRVDELTATVVCNGKTYHYRQKVYFMMNKPAGVISATADASERTVLDVFKEAYGRDRDGDLSGIPLGDIFPAGRLDKDTVGLLLLTNDGELAHRILSPGSHVPKTYYVETDLPVETEQLQRLQQGVSIGEKAPVRATAAEKKGERSCLLTITEGKFHQVKRMLEAVGLTVVYLKRLSIGHLKLDEQLLEGEIRELTKEEVANLC